MSNNPIDAVILWVDDSDPEWIQKKNQILLNSNVKIEDERFRDEGTLKYVLRSIEVNAPWMNKVFLVTDGQKPKFLNLKNTKLRFIKHSDFISKKYLPTFNSNVIELNLANIDELSDNFILFNDDMIINTPVKENDFFINNTPCDSAIMNPLFPSFDDISNIIVNDLRIINDKFSKRNVLRQHFHKFFNINYGKYNLKNINLAYYPLFCGFVDYHIPYSYKKMNFLKIYSEYSDNFIQTFNNKFRSPTDINHWLIRYWQLASGKFVPRKCNFGLYLRMSEIDTINLELKNNFHKVLCLNDVKYNQYFKNDKVKLLEMLENKFPYKSSFEI